MDGSGNNSSSRANGSGDSSPPAPDYEDDAWHDELDDEFSNYDSDSCPFTQAEIENSVAAMKESYENTKRELMYRTWYDDYAQPLLESLHNEKNLEAKLELFVLQIALQGDSPDDKGCVLTPLSVHSNMSRILECGGCDDDHFKKYDPTEQEKAAFTHILDAYKKDPSSVNFALDAEFQLTKTEPAPLVRDAKLAYTKAKKRLKNAKDKVRSKENTSTAAGGAEAAPLSQTVLKKSAAGGAAPTPLSQTAPNMTSSSSNSDSSASAVKTTVSCAKSTDTSATLKIQKASKKTTTLDNCSASDASAAANSSTKDTHARLMASA